MCKNHDLFHYPVELRDLAYRIADVQVTDSGENEQRKTIAFLLLKQATVVGLLEAADSILPKRSGKADMIRAKIMSVSAAYSGEAAAYYQEVLGEDAEIEDTPF